MSEATKTGKKRYTYVAAGGRTIARQELTDTDTQIVGWQFRDATGLSSRGFSNEELDGLGNNVGIFPNLTSSRIEDAMTTGESPTFTDMGMGDCQYNGTFMPCSMAYIFEGYDSPYMADWGTFFSKRHRLPFEADGKYRYAKNNPMFIANDILRQNRTDPPRGLGDPERPERELYEAGYLSFLLGAQNKTVEDAIRSIFDSARRALNTKRKDPSGLDCADLFAGKGMEFLDAYEKSIGKGQALRFGDKDADGKRLAPDQYAVTSQRKTVTIGREKYSVITLNTTSQLFNSNTFAFSDKLSRDVGHLSFVDFWAAALLHEIGHAIRKKYGSMDKGGGLIDPDGNDAARSLANQRFVIDHCFPKP
ncbi:MAG: hypothetical protein KF881_04545 [Acidobacteria bacterium]|nr:hypothetical protein [Acidobacteriota bacterium]